MSKCLDFKVTAERLELLIKYAHDAESKQKATDDLIKHLQAGQPEVPAPIVALKMPPPPPKKAQTEDETAKENG